MDNILDRLQKELNRCNNVLKLYEKIENCKISEEFIKKCITFGNEALISDDITKIIHAIGYLEKIEPEFTHYPYGLYKNINREKQHGKA